jgi:hypothetical protein
MSDDSEQVTALIRELLILNREESTPIEFPSEKEIEGRKAQRRRIRQSSWKFSIFATGKGIELAVAR